MWLRLTLLIVMASLFPPLGSAADKVVYLTFDDGPQPGTTDVLAALKEEGATAGFFLTGSNALTVGGIEEQTAIVRRMLAEGNEVGSHCYVHHPMSKGQYAAVYGSLSNEEQRAAFRVNFARNEHHFRQHLAQPDFKFRWARLPGDGGTLKHLVDETEGLGMRHFYWQFEVASNGAFKWLKCRDWQGIPGVDTEDPALPASGSVILFHDRHWAGPNKAKLVALLRLLKSNGYRFGKLSEWNGR